MSIVEILNLITQGRSTNSPGDVSLVPAPPAIGAGK